MHRNMKNSGVEWIGNVPIDWTISKVGRIGKYINGYAFKPEDWGSDGLPIIRIQNLSNTNNEYNMHNGKLEDKYIISKGDYLISWSATLDIFKWQGEKAYLNQHIFKAIPYQDYVNYNYFYWLAKCFMLEMSNDKHGSAMQHVTKGIFNNFPIALPNKKEQFRIANFLDERVSEIDNIIAKTTLSIEEYKKYKQSIITEAVTKGLNPNVEMTDIEIDYIGTIPKGWKIRRLRYLGTLQNGISKGSDYFGYGFPFISYSDVYKNMELPLNGSGLIDSNEAERENYSVKQGDVLFTRTSETIEEVGFASTCLKTIKDAVFAGFVIRFRPLNSELNINYSKYYFRSEIHRRFFVKEMNLVTRASLSQELLKKLPVIIPPEVEQQKIADYLDKKCYEIDSIISQKEQLLLDINAYKKSLIYECVTGKREV